MKTTAFKFTSRKGIDDLKSIYAFYGNSQGDHTVTNSIEEYKRSEGWLSYSFTCPMTEEAIAQEIAKRIQWNSDYIEQLKASGEYGKEVEHSLEMVHNPLWDGVAPKDLPPTLSTYSFVVLDVTEDKPLNNNQHG